MNKKNLLRELMKRYSFEKAHSIVQILMEDKKFENDDVSITMTCVNKREIFIECEWKQPYRMVVVTG